MVSDELKALAKEWLRLDKNPATRKEIDALVAAGDAAGLSQRLATRIEFGTAGLRARMEAGFARMNDLTVIQASQGVASYLLRTRGGDAAACSVVIGHDHRRFGALGSARFARLAAAVFLHRGIRVHFYRGLVHTPLVPFAVTALRASCGIMVTASHNPKEDNGYKLYWDRGCQIVPPIDAEIAREIEQNLEPWVWDDGMVARLLEEKSALVDDPTDKMVVKYMEAVRDLAATVARRDRSAAAASANEPAVRLCYTAMHGVGLPFMRRAFDAAALPPFFLTPEQIQPDPDFPTVAFPNPEEGKGALALACAAADANDATVILANDPDADRLAVAEKQPDGAWYVFSGNQIGIMLAAFTMPGFQRKHAGKKLAALTTTVSSMMIKQMAEQEGLDFEETLTGFKWLGNVALDIERDRGCAAYFAFEQAIGFMCGDIVRDKDGVSAGVCLGELAHWLAGAKHDDPAHPKTLFEYLQSLYIKYGFFASNDGYVVEHDPKKVDSMFTRVRPAAAYDLDLRAVAAGEAAAPAYPPALGDFAVRAVRDLTAGYDSTTHDRAPRLPVSRGAHMITFTFAVPARLGAERDANVRLLPCKMTLRTSGTEPKVKYYTELAGQWVGAAETPSADKISAIQRVADGALAELVRLTREQWLVAA